MMRHFIAAAAVIGTASVASAAIIETEVNNTTALANAVPTAFFATTGGFAFDGNIAPLDVDYLTINLNAGDYVGVALFHLAGAGASVQLLDPTLTQIAASSAPIPAFGLLAPATGAYYIGITGVGDLSFVGQHSQSFSYKLGVSYNAVPEPATLGLLAGAAVLGLRRRG